MNTPIARAPLSAVDAVRQAIEVTRRQLFPFRLAYWLPLGLLAFLDQCGRSGGFSGPPFPGGSGSGSGAPPDVGAAGDWLGAHVGTAVLVAAVVLAAIIAFVALVLWVNSRGIFMYLDAVATGRADVARPWAEYAEEAGSLFAWRFALAAAGLLLAIGILSVVVVAAFGLRDGRFDSGVALVVALVAVLGICLFALLALALVSVALRDFVAPLQMLHRVSCRAGLEIFFELLRAHPGTFLLYLFLKIVFAGVLGVMAFLVGCVTCCIGFLPVAMQTLLQPAFYFERAWSLCLLQQAGHDLFALRPAAPSGLGGTAPPGPDPGAITGPPTPEPD